MLKLNPDGKKIKKAIIEYLKAINEYQENEDQTLIIPTAILYQSFVKYLEKAEDIFDEDEVLSLKLHALSSKYFVNYSNNLKTLGFSAIQRKKLNAVEEEEESDLMKMLADASV